MKKAKIMLMAIAVLAVVGGALAFKAKNQGNTFWCNTTVPNGPVTCVAAPYLSGQGDNLHTSILFTAPGTLCPQVIFSTVGCNGLHPAIAKNVPM